MGEIVSTRRSGTVSFRPHARLIRLLGDELISDEIMAVVELVKNGYDADASQVHIALDQVTDRQSGCIRIRDNGDGMDLSTLLNIWMEPANSQKRTRHQHRQRTPQGRIFLGEKGVGRFAADKLGAELELVTRGKGADREIVLHVFWHYFDDDLYMEDVKSSWYEQEPAVFPSTEHGTLLTIRSLRTVWTEELVSRLYNGLARLISPFRQQEDFVIEIACQEFAAIEGKVVNHLLETAPYHLSGTIDRDGNLHLSGTQDSSVDLTSSVSQHFRTAEGGKRTPLCGPCAISLYIWDLDILQGKGAGVDKARRDAIRSFCGVSIYRDTFRVWPYGERDDDWLELNQRRVNNPTLRVSNNQIVGFIEITHENNPELKDRTSREGLIDTPAFFDLKVLVLSALSLLEAERFQQRHQEETPARMMQLQAQSDEILGYLSKVREEKTAAGVTLQRSTHEIEKLYRQKMAREQERYQRLSALAGVGIAAEFLSDALAREVNSTVTLLQILQGEAQKHPGTRVQEIVEKLTGRMKLIYEQLDLTAPLYRPEQASELVNIRGAVYDLLLAIGYQLRDAHIKVHFAYAEELIVRLSRGYLMQAMLIIISNAIDALTAEQVAEPQITIRIVIGSNGPELLLANNGLAVPAHYRKLIFEPSFSLRQAGRGLGLHIARDLLAIDNCRLELAEEEAAPEEVCFRIRFDRRRIVVQEQSGHS